MRRSHLRERKTGWIFKGNREGCQPALVLVWQVWELESISVQWLFDLLICTRSHRQTLMSSTHEQPRECRCHPRRCEISLFFVFVIYFGLDFNSFLFLAY